MALTDADKRLLCAVAREAVAAAVGGRDYAPPETASAGLAEKRGCFVTLKTGGELRGCIGCFASDAPLTETVAVYARHSALDDPRFAGRRLGPDDLPRLDVEISVLSPIEPTTEPEAIIPGVHGIHVSAGGRSGCFLPQVASETGWSVEEFWGRCCRDKAGLDWDAWLRPETTTMIFTAEAFGC